MLHISELGKHLHLFQHHADKDGHVPETSDHWSDMNYDHGARDPDEPGIDDEERQRRIAYLDEQWWPKVLAEVNKGKDQLSQLPGGNPIRKWRDAAMQEPPGEGGFEVEPYTFDE